MYSAPRKVSQLPFRRFQYCLCWRKIIQYIIITPIAFNRFICEYVYLTIIRLGLCENWFRIRGRPRRVGFCHRQDGEMRFLYNKFSSPSWRAPPEKVKSIYTFPPLSYSLHPTTVFSVYSIEFYIQINRRWRQRRRCKLFCCSIVDDDDEMIFYFNFYPFGRVASRWHITNKHKWAHSHIQKLEIS